MKTRTLRKGTKKDKPQTVCLKYFNRNAPCVCIAGTFNDWNPKLTPMISNGMGEWSKELQLPSGIYEYQYVVEGQWINDPQAVKSTLNPYGGRNSILRVE